MTEIVELTNRAPQATDVVETQVAGGGPASSFHSRMDQIRTFCNAALGALAGKDTVATADIDDNAVTLAKLSHETSGGLLTYAATTQAPTIINPVAAGRVLTDQGAGSVPTWEPPAGDMKQSTYDPTGVGADCFALANQVDGGGFVKMTTQERTDITTNNAKVSNATHTGEVTGSVALTITDAAVVESKIADNAVTLAKQAHGTAGGVIVYDATGAPVDLGAGTDGYVLKANGAGAAPAWEAEGGGSAWPGEPPADGNTYGRKGSDTSWQTVYTQAEADAIFIGSTGVTYENLSANGDVGSGAGQVADGTHNHDGIYAAVVHDHADNVRLVYENSGGAAGMRIQCSQISGSNTRILAMPDRDVDVGSGVGIEQVLEYALGTEGDDHTVAQVLTSRAPWAMTVVGARISCTTAPTGTGTLEVDVRNGGVTIFTTNPAIAANEKSSQDPGGTAAVIKSDGTENFTDDVEITFNITAIGGTTAGQGAKVRLYVRRTA